MQHEGVAPESIPASLDYAVNLVPVPAPARPIEAELLTPESEADPAAHALAALSDARRALASLATLPEAMEIVSQARALTYYLRQRRTSEELINEAQEINLIASRRGGDILLVMKKNKGAATPSHDESAPPPTLAQMGLDHNQSHRLQQLAAIPEAVFAAYLHETRQKRDMLSAIGLLRYFRNLERSKQSPAAGQEPGATAAAPCPCEPLSSPAALAETIVARVMDCVQEALADLPAEAVRAGFEQAVDAVRLRLAALSGLASYERERLP